MKWYQERTFRFAMWALNIMGLLGVIGISLVDKGINLVGLLFNAFSLVVVLPMAYLMRNNK